MGRVADSWVIFVIVFLWQNQLNIDFIGFPLMWRCFLWHWHYASVVVVKRQISISFFSHVLMSMPPLDDCFIILTIIIIIIAIFVITIFIIVLQNYFNMNVNFLNGTSKYCKIVNYFCKKALSWMFDGNRLFCFVHFSTSFWMEFRENSPKKNLVTCMVYDYFTKFLSF